MAKKIYTVVAPCVALVLALAFVEPPGAAACTDGKQRHHRTLGRRHGAERKKPLLRRRTVSYVCPMHPDMRSNSPGACPKCLMELVRKDVKPARRE
jgi:hypothetical protein